MSGPRFFDRVKESSSTTGTGQFTLSGAQAGFRAFGDVLSNNDTCLYCIQDQAGNNWEVGLGTYVTSGAKLTRTTVLASSNSNALVNFGAGTKDVFITWSADATGYLNPTSGYSGLVAYQAGRIGFPNDGFSLARDTGAALAPWGPIFPLTLPVNGDFAWINQGSATVTAAGGGIFLNDPATASFSLRIRKKAAPATPYVITAMLLPYLPNIASSAGILFRESSSGKLAAMLLTVLNPGTGGSPPQASPAIIIGKLDSPTSYNADYFRNFMIPPLFMRIADDGVNRITSVSWDGQNFATIHSVGRTDFITADEVGFFTASFNGTNDSGMNLLSWKQA